MIDLVYTQDQEVNSEAPMGKNWSLASRNRNKGEKHCSKDYIPCFRCPFLYNEKEKSGIYLSRHCMEFIYLHNSITYFTRILIPKLSPWFPHKS